ncbi:hypothetical protein CR513_00004, partial [Mucuna pruriens]
MKHLSEETAKHRDNGLHHGFFVQSRNSYSQHLFGQLQNLLLVPAVTKNLISASQFARDNSVYFEFHPTFCLFKSQASSGVLLHGTIGSDGLYIFGNILSIPPTAATSPLTPCVNSVGCKTGSSSCLGNTELIEVKFGTKLQGVQTNGGEEFRTLTPYFAKHGICLAPDGRIFISKDLLFNEHKFPYSSPSSKLSMQPTSVPPQSTSFPLFLLPQSPTATPTSTAASPVINSSPALASPSHSVQHTVESSPDPASQSTTAQNNTPSTASFDSSLSFYSFCES